MPKERDTEREGGRNRSDAPLFEQMTIIGVGLIGGSLARAARRAGLVSRFVGAGRRVENLKKALALGVIDRFEADHLAAVKGSDLVVVCTPVQAQLKVVKAILPALGDGTVVTDVGSVKGPFIRGVEALGAGQVHFVGGHPIAGTEHTGVEASFADLFVDHKTILTPTGKTDQMALDKIKALWEGVGAEVEVLSLDEHDRILSDVSHLPHLVAYAMVNAALKGGGVPYGAGGFRDFTRIASSSPEMWRDICLENRQALLTSLETFEECLGEIRRAIDMKDGRTLEAEFRRAKEGRDTWLIDKGRA